MKKIVIAVVAVLVVAVGGFLVYANFIREDAEPELTLSTTTAPAADGSDTTTAVDSTDTTADAASGDGVDGTWNVEQNDVTTAGFRIDETFVGGLDSHTAVGRTDVVTGSITVAGTEVTEGSFTADLTALEFTDDPPGLNVANRKRAMENGSLEINQFPEATFTLTAPIDLGEVPAEGTPISAEATGELTLHGVTKEITFTVDAQLIDGKIEVVSQDPVEVVLADYEIDAPTFGPVADASDTGFFEFQIQFTKA